MKQRPARGDGLRDLGIPPRGDGLRDLGTPEQFARLKPVKGRHYAYVRETGIRVLLHDDARRKELSRRAWGGEEL
jgi:hypothetical protein